MKSPWWVIGILLAVSAGVAWFFVDTATERTFTSLEGALFQLAVMALGLTGTYLMGRRSTERAARAIIKPHARAAFRRMLTLYDSLSRLATQIQAFREADEPKGLDHMMDVFEAIVTEQLATGDHALEDWRDIVPEEVEALEEELEKRKVSALRDGGVEEVET